VSNSRNVGSFLIEDKKNEEELGSCSMMTADLIKKLQKFEKKHPGSHVSVEYYPIHNEMCVSVWGD
jgi:hypothetical protein